MATVKDAVSQAQERPDPPSLMKPRGAAMGMPSVAELGATRYYVNVDSVQSGPRGDATQEQIQKIGDAVAEAVQAELGRIGVKGKRAYDFLLGYRFEVRIIQENGEL